MALKYPEYAGLAYDSAYREGQKLIKQIAKENGSWFSIVDRLIELRTIMNAHFDKAM